MRKLLFFLVIALLGAMYSCEKDSLTGVEEALQFEVPDIPDDIAQYFTEEELATFRAGPPKAMLNEVQTRSGNWYPVVIKFKAEFYERPVLNSCEDPVICTDPSACSDPTHWAGRKSDYTGKGAWHKYGRIDVGTSGTITCFTGGYVPPEEVHWYWHRNGEIYYNTTAISQEIFPDGSYTRVTQANYYDGTGLFEGAYGQAIGRYSGNLDDLPDIYTGEPGHVRGGILGWIHY